MPAARWIARYLSSSGTYPAARDLFVLIAEAHRDDDAYGPEHRDTLAAYGNLARWTGEAGDAAGARDEYAELLPIAERVLGPEHPATLTTRTNLARWTGEAADAAAARDHYAALVDMSGSWARSTRTPRRPATTSPPGRGRRGIRPGRATGTPRCCRSMSGSWAPSTRTPCPPAPTSPPGPGRRGMPPGPATSSLRCCRSMSGSWAPSTRTP